MREMTEYEVELFDQTGRIPDLHVPLHRGTPQDNQKAKVFKPNFHSLGHGRKAAKASKYA